MSFAFSMVNVFSVSAKGFFITLQQGHYDVAYGFMSDQYKRENTLETFKAQMEQTGLNQYRTSDWIKTFKSDDDTTGYVMGTITTKTGRKIPIKINYIATGTSWMNREWRIQSIELHINLIQENNLMLEKPGR